MKKQHYDAIIIGAGQAGPSLAVKYAQNGKQVAIVERQFFGGTCVNTGCIPTKALVASAHAAYLCKHAAEFGVSISGDVIVDMPSVRSRKDAIVAKASAGVEAWLRNTPGVTVYNGHAKFIEPYSLSVGDEIMTAEHIFINVGARAFIPPIPGLDKVSYFTNSSIMAVDFIPEHLIILGGSYIGLEFAQMYRRFGSKVTIIEKAARLISREDRDISEAVLKILQDEGVVVHLNSDCVTIANHNENVVITMSTSGEEKVVEGSHLLLAIGRQPNTHDLGLEKTEIETDKNGYIRVDDHLRTNVKNIWAMGECNGKGAFTHTAYNDYEIVSDNLFDGGIRKVSDRIMTYGLFIDPPLGRAGMTEQEAMHTSKHVLVSTRPMSLVKRAVIKGDARGFMKVLIDGDTNQILGAAVLGVGGDEVIHSILDLMYAKSPYNILKNAVHIHPTVSELIPTMLADVQPLSSSE